MERKKVMKVFVDRDLCIGCGLCVATCPEVFEMDDEDKAVVISEPADTSSTLQEAVDSCPTAAISIE